ncbi:MAG: IS630 family transposase [Dysgonamonadaceae bacterium]|jgi:transposase|nr:IS630 family transposase [Dysgonamonadaceae bacterium]
MGKIKEIHLSSAQTGVPENGYQPARAHFLRQRCLAVVLKSQGLSSPKTAEKADLCQQSITKRVSGFLSAGIAGLENRPGQGSRRRNDTQSCRSRQAGHKSSEIRMGSIFGQDRPGGNLQTFFIRIGAGYKRISKRPEGKPSPQLHANKREKLQKLESQYTESLTDLYCGDESHVCTGGCVPYGWQFGGEDCYVPSGRKLRLNGFGIIDGSSSYDGFATTETVSSGSIIEYPDGLPFRIGKKTVIVPDNAGIHRARKVMCYRALWEKRGLFIFFLSPYSPHLNPAETLWRILRGKWVKPQDYIGKDDLFHAADRALANVG